MGENPNYHIYRIIPGTIKYLTDCKDAWLNSELGRAYFKSDEDLTSALINAIENQEIFIALDGSGNCLGYICIAIKGAFCEFPYCRSLAVKESNRGMGVGTTLLNYYEKIGFKNADKLFILVSDFNKRAKKLYEKLGYLQVGSVPNLFKEGITEYIMVKDQREYLKKAQLTNSPTPKQWL